MKVYSALLLFLVASSASGVSLFGGKEAATKHTDVCNGLECPEYAVLEKFDVSIFGIAIIHSTNSNTNFLLLLILTVLVTSNYSAKLYFQKAITVSLWMSSQGLGALLGGPGLQGSNIIWYQGTKIIKNSLLMKIKF